MAAEHKIALVPHGVGGLGRYTRFQIYDSKTGKKLAEGDIDPEEVRDGESFQLPTFTLRLP